MIKFGNYYSILVSFWLFSWTCPIMGSSRRTSACCSLIKIWQILWIANWRMHPTLQYGPIWSNMSFVLSVLPLTTETQCSTSLMMFYCMVHHLWLYLTLAMWCSPLPIACCIIFEIYWSNQGILISSLFWMTPLLSCSGRAIRRN